MSWVSTIFSGGVDKIVDSVANGIDALVTSDEEKLVLRNALQKEMNRLELETEKQVIKYEAEITKRNADDQKSGNFLTKSARPIFLYWIMFIISVMVFGGLFEITIDAGYIELVKVLSVAAVTFFFGSKGMEAYRHGKIL